MIAGCIDRMRTDNCGDCERRDACSQLFSGLFGPGAAAPRWSRRAEAPRRPAGRNMFLTILGEVAKAVERNVRERREAEAREAPAAREAAVPAARAPGPFQNEVEAHLAPLLATGPLRIDSVARALGYSRQTLYRRLKAEGVTFEEVLDGLRRRLALRFIREEGMAVKEAAWRLGFSDPAAFSRAFKRWTGTTPKAARRPH